MAQHMPIATPLPSGNRLRLAAVDGVILIPSDHQRITPMGAPEAPLEVEFEGIDAEQQRAALDGFPGGRRFVLKVAN